MTQCLVTKLKGVVDNDNLEKFGHVRIAIKAVETPSEDAQLIRINGASGTKLSVVGNGYMATSYSDLDDISRRVQELTIPSNGTLSFCVSNGNYSLDIDDKYNLTAIARRQNKGVYHFNLDDLKYCTNISELKINLNYISGDIASLENLNISDIQQIDFSNSDVIGDIASLANFTNLNSLTLSETEISGDIASLASLTNLTSMYLNGTEVSGDIASLASLTNLNSLFLNETEISGNIASLASLTNLTVLYLNARITGDVANMANLTNLTRFGTQGLYGDIADMGTLINLTSLVISGSSINGTLESFVAAQKENGRSACESIGAAGLLSMVTFGGENYNYNRQWISWDDHKTVVYVDATGTQSKDQATIIYAQGATAAEIAAWEGAGKTVTVIS